MNDYQNFIAKLIIEEVDKLNDHDGFYYYPFDMLIKVGTIIGLPKEFLDDSKYIMNNSNHPIPVNEENYKIWSNRQDEARYRLEKYLALYV